jgi:hypothetical protein
VVRFVDTSSVVLAIGHKLFTAHQLKFVELLKQSVCTNSLHETSTYELPQAILSLHVFQHMRKEVVVT